MDSCFKTMINEWFDYGILGLIDCVELKPTLSFFGMACLSKIECDAFGAHVWFYYEYKTRKKALEGGLTPMVCKLADEDKEKGP